MPAPQEDAPSTGLRTDLGPMVTRFHRFGELESAQWVMWLGNNRMIPDRDHPMTAVLHLKPGQVNRLLAGRTSEPADKPVVAADDNPGRPGLPASVGPYVPADAAWILIPELDEVLVRASGTHVLYDPVRDIAVVSCINPGDPDEVRDMVDAQGNTSTVTPSPFVPPS